MSKIRVTTYRETMPNGDELVSEYGDGWQRAYVIPKAQLDYWKREAKHNQAALSPQQKPRKAGGTDAI